jgi:crotonobetainyl-CoA:carnitine CoA-transferase CaiB-like acyl-CoA transferase
VDDGHGGTEPGLGSPITLDGSNAPGLKAAPRVGHHSHEILREFGFTDAEIDRLAADEVVWQG